MPTENPKISAYVPQAVYDRFKEYQEERELSMSQAAIEIFAHYLGINLEEPTKEFTGGLPGRLIVLEQSVSKLEDLYAELIIEVNQIKSTSGILKNRITNELVDKKIEKSELLSEPKSGIDAEVESESKDGDTSELPNELKDSLDAKTENESKDVDTSQLPSELLSELKSGIDAEVESSGISKPPSELKDETLLDDSQVSSNLRSEVSSNLETEVSKEKELESPLQLNIIESTSSPKSSLLENVSLTGIKLGERLSIDRTTLGSRRKKLSTEKFAEMTSEKDPDGIKWVYSEDQKSYVPLEALSNEQSENLKIWKEQRSKK